LSSATGHDRAHEGSRARKPPSHRSATVSFRVLLRMRELDPPTTVKPQHFTAHESTCWPIGVRHRAPQPRRSLCIGHLGNDLLEGGRFQPVSTPKQDVCVAIAFSSLHMIHPGSDGIERFPPVGVGGSKYACSEFPGGAPAGVASASAGSTQAASRIPS